MFCSSVRLVMGERVPAMSRKKHVNLTCIQRHYRLPLMEKEVSAEDSWDGMIFEDDDSSRRSDSCVGCEALEKRIVSGKCGVILNSQSMVAGLGVLNFERSCELLYARINEILKTIVFTTPGQVQVCFTIGKTFVTTKLGTTFHPGKLKTWKDDGIRSRWNTHYKKEGYQHLIVLGCVTRKMCRDLGFVVKRDDHVQEDYALAMEQRLTHQYRFVDKNINLLNGTSASGSTTTKGRPHVAYVIYVAVKLVS